ARAAAGRRAPLLLLRHGRRTSAPPRAHAGHRVRPRGEVQHHARREGRCRGLPRHDQGLHAVHARRVWREWRRRAMSGETDRSVGVTRRRFTRDLVTSGAGALLLPNVLRGTAHGQAKPGGQLTVAPYNKASAPSTPIRGSCGTGGRTPEHLTNNRPRLTATGGVEGDLAESYTAGANSATWTFVLRDGVRFHDGSALGAGDVVATIEKILDPKTAASYKAELGPIASVRAVDRRTVRIDLASPYADLPKALASAMARIVSERGITDFGKLDTTVYGTGPFVLKEFVANERVVMERNPRYFRSGRPYLDRLVLRVLP